jgi:ribosomal protein S20
MRDEPTRNAYMKSELRNILAAIALAAQSGNHSQEYADGFEAALSAIAVATGLVQCPARRTVRG